MGYMFKMGGHQAYANLRGYYEYWAEKRVQGFSLFAMVNIPLGGGNEAAPTHHAGK